MSLQDEIAEMKRKLAELEKAQMGQTELPAEITVVLPTRNGLTYPHDLPQVFWRLGWGSQSALMHMRVGSQEMDPKTPHMQDGTREWLLDREKNPSQPPAGWFKSFKVLKPRHFGSQAQNLCAQMKLLVEGVETKYILFVEDDTLLPLQKGSVRILLEALQSDPDLAMVGYLYERHADHVNMGCSMARADVMKDICVNPGWKAIGNCVCRWLYQEELPRRGLKAMNVLDWYTHHLKRER